MIQYTLNGKPKKYLTLMPWEQLNNQLIEFKAACATSIFLGRTLVLPFLGWRKVDSWDFSYNILDFEWNDFQKYFDLVSLESLPCDFITMEEYLTYHSKDSISMKFNPVAKATSHEQLQDYYCQVLKLPCDIEIEDIGRRQQISRTEIEQSFGTSNSLTLAFGAMFWFYDFNRFQPYPLLEYINYMDDPIYNSIVSSLEMGLQILKSVDIALKKLGSFNAVHIRRGDYHAKCSKIKNLELQRKCFPSTADIEKKLTEKFDPALPLYISTNIGSDKSEFAGLQRKFKLYFISDILDMAGSNFDQIELSLFDQKICSVAQDFVGNFYSSFSRSIFEFRDTKSKPYDYW